MTENKFNKNMNIILFIILIISLIFNVSLFMNIESQIHNIKSSLVFIDGESMLKLQNDIVIINDNIEILQEDIISVNDNINVVNDNLEVLQDNLFVKIEEVCYKN